MTILSAALEARGKQLNVDVYPCLPYDKKEAIKDAIDESRERSLDWIAEALPTIKERAGEIQESIQTAEEFGFDNPGYQHLLPEWKVELATLAALIAQAEGQKEGENE